MSDVIPVERDGEDIEVYNWVTVRQEHQVNSVGGYETFHGPVLAGDGSIGAPEAITPRVASVLRDFGITDTDLQERDIEVIDPDSEEVTRL